MLTHKDHSSGSKEYKSMQLSVADDSDKTQHLFCLRVSLRLFLPRNVLSVPNNKTIVPPAPPAAWLSIKVTGKTESPQFQSDCPDLRSRSDDRMACFEVFLREGQELPPFVYSTFFQIQQAVSVSSSVGSRYRQEIFLNTWKKVVLFLFYSWVSSTKYIIVGASAQSK